MSTQSERLKQLRTTLGLTTTALAQAVGYTQGTISQLENSPEKTLEKRLIRALHLAFGVNEEWLRSGVGGDAPLFDPKPEMSDQALADFLRDCLSQLSNPNRNILINVIRDLAASEADTQTLGQEESEEHGA
ncbi:MAG: helix-turn-helix domain-containing protein [Thermoguttaceae bacterium]|jgi:transcriptional regulator with XRE-family HTH domain